MTNRLARVGLALVSIFAAAMMFGYLAFDPTKEDFMAKIAFLTMGILFVVLATSEFVNLSREE